MTLNSPRRRRAQANQLFQPVDETIAHGAVENREPPRPEYSMPARVIYALIGAAAGLILTGLVIDAPILVFIALAYLAGLLTLWLFIRPTQQKLKPSVSSSAMTAESERIADQIWELKESAERFRSVVDTLGDAIVRRDFEGRVVFVNDAFARTFGVDAQALIGHPLDLRPISQAEGAASEIGHRNREVCLSTRDGPRWFSWIDLPVRDDGDDRPHLQSIIRDITELRSTQDALIGARDQSDAANQAKSRFLAAVSHEIRTPLNGILGMAQLLIDTKLTKEQTAYAGAVSKSGRALLSLIDDILDFSKIEAGRLELRPAPTNVHDLVEGVMELLAPRAQDKGLEMAHYVAANVPPTMKLDGARLRQVLLNLAGNGVKFTQTGGVAVIVEMTGGPQPLVMFSVRDTGIGIDEVARERIFEEFEQADPGLDRRFGGTGLGLSISREIVRLMGGDISVDSRLGQGSAFTFDLPVAEQPRAVVPPEGLAGRRVICLSKSIIEIPLLVRRLQDAQMSVSDHTTLQAANDAIADKSAGPVDLVMIDGASRADPAADLKALTETSPDGVSACILITPSQRSQLEDLRDAGFGTYLVKPVRLVSLLRAMQTIHGGEFGIAGAEHPATRTPAQKDKNGRRVLLVEDNDINALLTRSVLSRNGDEVELATDGKRAVGVIGDAFEGNAPGYDCILMDLHMPGMDGLAATRQIRSLERDHGRPATPIIVLTADGLEETKRACLAAGADRILAKPAEADRLILEIDQFCS